jgi:hypothetical protein
MEKYFLILTEEGKLILLTKDYTYQDTIDYVIMEFKKDYDVSSPIVDNAVSNSYENLLLFKTDFLRALRNKKLKESDLLWIEASSKKKDLDKVESYKQQLRDLPQTLNVENMTLEEISNAVKSIQVPVI